MQRPIVMIDEELCDGCGLCVPSCEEGALKIVNGKAKLLADRLCDGLGACLGHCPRGAIRVEQREAEAFDESAVAELRHRGTTTASPARRGWSAPQPLPVHDPAPAPNAGGCPGSRLASFNAAGHPAGKTAGEQAGGSTDQPSALTQWPVQLRLLPPTAPFFRRARLLVAADCVPFACANFHANLLKDHALAIACPKLDDPRGYVEKLAEMIRTNDFQEISVARMEVPCCLGILHAVLEARRQAEVDVPVTEVVVGIRGEVLASRELPPEAAPAQCRQTG